MSVAKGPPCASKVFNMNFTLTRQHLMICLIVMAGPIYFIINHGCNFLTLVPTLADTKFLLPCNHSDPRAICERAKSLYNASFSLSDIDRIAFEEYINSNCASNVDPSRPKFLIIIPYRNRIGDLMAFLMYILPYFRYQGVQMDVLIAEQNGTAPFNRAKLFNAAIREVDRANNISQSNGHLDRLAGITCFSFHDVDKLPDNPDVPYYCSSGPQQLMRFRQFEGGSNVMYPTFLGGVTMFTREQLEKMNGASNSFVGWGGEDDDMWRRIHMAKMKVELAPFDKGKFYESNHKHERNLNPERFKLLSRKNQDKIMLEDGLRQVWYTLIERRDYKTFVWLLLEV